MIVDYHMHLAFDEDPLDEAALDPASVLARWRAAQERGVGEICLTEHCYRFTAVRELSDHPFWQAEAVSDLEAYVRLVTGVRDDGWPSVLAGLELDWLDGRREALAAVVEGLDLDIVLGSVHFLGDLLVDHPAYSIWDHLPVDEVYRRYFEALREAALSGLYDVMAHPDLAKVFGDRPPGGPPLAEYEATAEAFAAAGVAAEVSTAGLRKPALELYPAQPFLEALNRHGVPITLGADAHRPEDVGRDFGLAVAAAREAGYTTVTVFRRREPHQEPLG